MGLDVLQLKKQGFKGEIFSDNLSRKLYATDASVYRMLPEAVAYPIDEEDIKLLIDFAKTHNTSLIPRAAGTSLAGQCVGKGIVVDVSKHFNAIIALDEARKTVTVQAGVVRDQLNNYLKPFGLFFGPNTSTSNRCMIGGMVGNNSSGTTSIQYGVTRDKVVALKTILSDGSEVVFKELSVDEFQEKTQSNTLEGHIYKRLYQLLSPKGVQETIKKEFPKPEIHRRNTGYAVDTLLQSNVFSNHKDGINVCKLLTGSEGTLAFTTEITLQLDDLPPQHSAMVACHFHTISDCLNAVQTVMRHSLHTCEMMDKTILDLTKYNKTQQRNRQFVVGDPQAILMCELKADTPQDLNEKVERLISSVKRSTRSYANIVLEGASIDKAMELRKAGLGLLGNMIGDKKSVACIEDTAVALPDLADFIKEFTTIMESYQQKAVYYAHAGAGELHLRPILNLKSSKEVELFRTITTEVAKLVKRFGGSMSGEHGDGIVRAEFIPLLIGKDNYELLKQIKTTFDPNNIFNPGKIVDAFSMDKNLRYQPDREEPEISTLMDFSASKGILREAEKCNGSGDCRKLPEFGGTMCPSFRATRNEKDSTRGRANALREVLTNSTNENRFDSKELQEVFKLCLSCKACKTECPSSVDVAALKAEFQYQYQKSHGSSWRSKVFAYNQKLNHWGSRFATISNMMFSNPITSRFIKISLGIATQRSLPKLSKTTLSQWIKQHKSKDSQSHIKTVYLFVDEFSDYLDAHIGQDVVTVLEALNYKVKYVAHQPSGRALISKGFLKEAKDMAEINVSVFKRLISEQTPLIGIEPSAIYTFKDEYPKLVSDKDAATKIAKHTYLIEEFLNQEIQLGHIKPDQFTTAHKTIKIHGHCYQKSLGNVVDTFNILNLPQNYKVTLIPSGCCGMAGSFGYEKEHYELSMTIGEQTLFPAIRKASSEVEIAANGTSCRHQILDGTQRLAKHPISILKEALV